MTNARILSLLACALLGACSGDPPPPRPPIVRVDVTPQFGEIERTDPEASLPPWKRQRGIVLGDLRSAHAFKPGEELWLPVPEGAGRLATALAAHMRGKGDREGQAQVLIEIAQWGEWRRIGGFEGRLARLLDGWVEVEMPLEVRSRGSARVRIQARIANSKSSEPVEFLVEPLRARSSRSTAGTADGPPNVLLVSIDTLRADHLSCYGYSRPTSPRIDGLAREGVLFEDVVSAAPWTLPSYGSLFTGCTPAIHRAGVVTAHEERFARDEDSSDDDLEVLRTDLPTLAEKLSDRGWATAGFQANSFLRAKNGLARGFDRWVFYQYHAPVGIQLALDWIERHESAPWFCFLHVMDVHQPYVPPPPHDKRFSERSHADVPEYPPAIDDLRAGPPEASMRKLLVDQYDGAIAYTDSAIGGMLDRLRELGLLDHTLVIVHSDHGEEFWEHGGYEHGHTEYEEVLRVPLVLRWPGRLPAGRRVEVRVRLIDLMPSLLDLLGLDPAPGVEGKSLRPLIEGRTEPPRECISEATLHGPREIKAFKLGNESLILRGGGQGRLFDLAADPGETRDLAAERRTLAREMEERLLRRHEIIHRSAVRANGMQLSEEERKRLREMGYTGGEDGK